MIKVNGEVVKFEKFPNGETKLIESSIDRNIGLFFPNISFKYEDDSDLIKLMFVKRYIDSLSRLASENAKLIIYYMPYSRMDRSENDSAFTLKYIAEFINSLKFKRVEVVEPHSDVTTALLSNAKAKYVNFDLLPKVMDNVSFRKEKDFLFFPDTGASKRYSNLKGFKQLVGHKNRDFKTGKIENLSVVGDVPMETGNSNVIIVDDLSSYGGTFYYSAKELKELGFNKIYLLVAHAENSIFDGKIFKTDLIDMVFTTNTIMSKDGTWLNKNYDAKLKVYDIEGVLSNEV